MLFQIKKSRTMVAVRKQLVQTEKDSCSPENIRNILIDPGSRELVVSPRSENPGLLLLKYREYLQKLYSLDTLTEQTIVLRSDTTSNRINHTGSTLYSEGSFVRRFFSPKPFEVAMVRRTYGPKVLYFEVPILRKLLCSEDSIFRKALHYMDFMLRRFFSPKFI